MPTIGPTELIVVLLIIMFVFGVGKLPEVGGALGRSVRELRAGMSDTETRRVDLPSGRSTGEAEKG